MARRGWRLAVRHVADEQRCSCAVMRASGCWSAAKLVLSSETAEGHGALRDAIELLNADGVVGVEKRRAHREARMSTDNLTGNAARTTQRAAAAPIRA